MFTYGPAPFLDNPLVLQKARGLLVTLEHRCMRRISPPPPPLMFVIPFHANSPVPQKSLPTLPMPCSVFIVVLSLNHFLTVAFPPNCSLFGFSLYSHHSFFIAVHFLLLSVIALASMPLPYMSLDRINLILLLSFQPEGFDPSLSYLPNLSQINAFL